MDKKTNVYLISSTTASCFVAPPEKVEKRGNCIKLQDKEAKPKNKNIANFYRHTGLISGKAEYLTNTDIDLLHSFILAIDHRGKVNRKKEEKN